MENRVKHIHDLGQSIWLDFIDREILSSGKLKQLIDEDGIRGVTSNPAIFEKAFSSSDNYQADIRKLIAEGKSDDDIFYALAIQDILNASEVLKPVYEDEEVKGADGYVSLEVSPELARHTHRTIDQALDLWRQLGRENVMIKIPGTAEGLPAIRKAISEGLNINVTLLFGLPRYKEVTEAYIQGLEDRLASGRSIENIASVASFFLSRIDLLVDPLLAEKGAPELKGKIAIASAKKAYEIYQQVFGSERWKKLESKGAKPQRLLWASTSSKDPSFKDTKYVEALIGPDTVNTAPLETIEAFRDHGIAEVTLTENLAEATADLEKLKSAGIVIDQITSQLENEGIEKFKKPYAAALAAIAKQR
ncbi:transaldolase [Pedobacter sp. HMF7647]|uniref:Transaldolase n=1 Tax=Hufsiella arboris TaxID=2695275 RepID=A0A7K1YEW9_9SPHI|nr:transaldolase [Hufsiella arboris]MXV53132.1 transaldolase [Hufsiella arboris]